jgi:hypothetical protein
LRDHEYDGEEDNAPLGSFASGICTDLRRISRTSSSPIRCEEDFNNFLFTNPYRTVGTKMHKLRSSMATSHHVMMTHSDLHPRSIMVTWDVDDQNCIVQKSVEVSSILDWEVAGWYPEYWEFVKAMHNAPFHGELKDWIDYLPTGSINRGGYMAEYAIDCMIDRWMCSRECSGLRWLGQFSPSDYTHVDR